MIASEKCLIAEINSMLIPGNAKCIIYSVMAKQRSPVSFQFEVYATLVLFVAYYAFYDRLKTPIPKVGRLKPI